MSGRIPRVIGTTDDAINSAETELGFSFPPSFRAWLLENNGTRIDGVDHVYPVFDKRDPRKTWDSIVRNFRLTWAGWIENFDGYGEPFDFSSLLPFASVGNGDFYCFDYDRNEIDGEVAVVLWSHESGETKLRAKTFLEFIEKARNGEFKFD